MPAKLRFSGARIHARQSTLGQHQFSFRRGDGLRLCHGLGRGLGSAPEEKLGHSPPKATLSDQATPVGRETRITDHAAILFEGQQLFTGLDIPELDHSVIASGGQRLLIRREGKLPAPDAMPRKLPDQLKRFSRPEKDLPCLRVDRSNEPTVVGKRRPRQSIRPAK